MTALELLEVDTTDPNYDDEFDQISGLAAPGDVAPELARRYIIGQTLMAQLRDRSSPLWKRMWNEREESITQFRCCRRRRVRPPA